MVIGVSTGKNWETMTRSKQEGGLGFRELEAFNIALLGKMAARVLAEPDSLWVRCLKGMYFPSSSFLQAVKGSRASWAWSSLLAGRDLVLEACVWSLRDGKTIRVFSDPWAHRRYDSRMGLHPVTEDQAQTRMEEWIDPQTRTWNVGAVREAVSAKEAETILSILILFQHKKDDMRWPYKKGGKVTTRSNYHYLRATKGQE